MSAPKAEDAPPTSTTVQTRLLILGTAPPLVVEQFLAELGDVEHHLWIKQDMNPKGQDKARTVHRLGGPLRGSDGALAREYARIRPTGVVILCGKKYWHDNVVEALLCWNRKADIRPKVFVYEHGILFEGYLESARQHPAFRHTSPV